MRPARPAALLAVSAVLGAACIPDMTGLPVPGRIGPGYEPVSYAPAPDESLRSAEERRAEEREAAEREAAEREAAAREAAAREVARRMRDEPWAGAGAPRRRAGHEPAPGGMLASTDRRAPGGAGKAHARPARVAQAPGATCREVVIRLPASIEFHGNQGTLSGTVETNLGPGTYKIRYDAKAERLIVDPWPSTKRILNVSLSRRRALFMAYLASMKQPVRLRVEDSSAPGTKRTSASAKGASNAKSTSAKSASNNSTSASSATEPCPDCTQVEGLSPDEAMQVMKALGADKRERSWMDFARKLAGREQLSADDVRKLLAEHRRRQGVRDAPARTTTEVVERSRVAAWNELDEWERDLWREYLGKYGHTADVTGADGFHITDDVRLSMALRMAPNHVKPGAREAWDALVNDPVFIGATAMGVTAYFALWLAPEPLVSKIGAVATTIGIVTMAGCSVAEIVALGRAWLRLRDEAARATKLTQLEAAAERFGKALGGTALRILLAVATAISAKVLPAAMPRPMPGGGPPPAAALPGGGNFVLGTTTPVRTIKVLKGGLVVFMAPPAMSTLGGSGNKPRRSDSSDKPAAAKPEGGKASQDKAAAAKNTKAKTPATKSDGGKAPAAKTGAPQFRPFIRNNFRENLGRFTGGIPEGMHAHHVLPIKFEKQFRAAGINIHEPRFGTWWEAKAHLKAKEAYNARWREFFRKNQTPSIEEILRFGRDTATEYGLQIYF